MKKYIVFVTRQFGRVSGGLGVSAERIASHLATDHDVTVIQDESTLPLGELRESKNADILSHFKINLDGDDKTAHQFLSDVLIAMARERKPDLVIAFYGDHLATTVTMTAKWIGVPSAVFLRGNDLDLEIFDSKSRLVESLERTDRVFCVSREIEDKVLSLIPTAKTVFVPNGVDTNVFDYSAPKSAERPVFGLIGDIKAKKGLALALDALDFTRTSLRINGTLRPDQMKLLHGYLMVADEARPSIEIVPFNRNAKAMAEAYHALDFVLVPSFHEGLPNVLLEAMSSGTVVIASRVAGICDVVEDETTGFLFDPWKDGDLACAVAKATAMPLAEKREMSERARESVERDFTLKRERNLYLKEFEALFSAPRKAPRRSLLSERYTGSRSDVRAASPAPKGEALPTDRV